MSSPPGVPVTSPPPVGNEANDVNEANEAIDAAEQEEYDDDGDSAVDVPLLDSLMSLRSSIMAYQHENGRTYHALSAGKYFLPNDRQEIERLDLQHHVLTLTIRGDHCLCPKNDGANRVLDLGTGTGIWAMEYADAHPESEVIGVDLSPVQPEFVPPNCRFEVDDLENDWTWGRPFDFVFSRMMAGSFSEYGSIVQKAFAHLEPGGYFEAQDMGLPMGCDDGTLQEDSDFWNWMTLVMDAMARMGRPVAAQAWKGLMEECGFEDVTETIYKWPTNSWPRESRYKELGMWSLVNMDSALEASTLAPLTRGLGWSRAEALVLVSKARKQLRDPSIHAYWPMYFVHGRKPLNAAAPNPTSPTTRISPGSPRPTEAALPKILEAEPR